SRAPTHPSSKPFPYTTLFRTKTSYRYNRSHCLKCKDKSICYMIGNIIKCMLLAKCNGRKQQQYNSDTANESGPVSTFKPTCSANFNFGINHIDDNSQKRQRNQNCEYFTPSG